MPIVDLDANKWGQVMSILADAPWKIANPLLMEIGEQLRHHQQSPTPTPEDIKRMSGNSQETHDGQ
jgi:hypothetical protein